MRTREYQDGDREAVAAIHALTGIDYKMPDLQSMAAKTVCEIDGRVRGAFALKMQAETYLWLDPQLTPREKWDAIRLMQRELARQATELNIGELVAYVPSCIKRFAKRMKMLRWNRPRDGWDAWVYEVKP